MFTALSDRDPDRGCAKHSTLRKEKVTDAVPLRFKLLDDAQPRARADGTQAPG
jgi:hypothetical protein